MCLSIVFLPFRLYPLLILQFPLYFFPHNDIFCSVKDPCATQPFYSSFITLLKCALAYKSYNMMENLAPTIAKLPKIAKRKSNNFPFLSLLFLNLS